MTTVALLPPAELQFCDLNGVPLAYGYLWTFVAPGNSVLATTYQDYLGTVPNTNPIRLDGSGRCIIWAPAGTYRTVLYDVNNVLIFDQIASNPINGALLAANNLSDLANVTTAQANLGLGTAAVINTGTAGHVLGFLDGNNTNSGTVTNSGSVINNGTVSFTQYPTLTPPGSPYTARIGFLHIPQQVKSTSYTLQVTDDASEIFNTASSTVTVPSTANLPLAQGAFVKLSWDTSTTGIVTVVGDTMRWLQGGSTAASRTITGAGFIMMVKEKATEWWVTGSNVT